MTALTGPADGTWVRVRSEQRVVYLRCDLCGTQVTEGWAYYVGLTSHATCCVGCADGLIDNDDKEVTMTGTAGITPEHLTEIALACESAHLDWEQGKATSPDTRDYVLLAEQVLTNRIGPEYLWLTSATRETVAEALYEHQCEGLLNEWAEMAEWLADAITSGGVDDPAAHD